MIDLLNKKAILIDMDGTLVDSHPVLMQVYFDFMKNMGVSGSKEEFQELVGPSMPEVVAILRQRYNIDLSVQDLVGRYHETLERVYTNQLKIFDGVKEFLSYVKSRGVKIALVTSATEHLAYKFLCSQGIDGFFNRVITPSEGKGKPAPDIYLRALKALSIHPDEAIVIEDSPNGVQAAVSAGIHTFHIFNTSLPEALCNNSLVTHVDDWHAVMRTCGETHGGI